MIEPMKFPSHFKGAIEARDCRGCHSIPGASCVEPQARAVSATVNFDDIEVGYRTFCYERVYDYFESHRPAIPGVHYAWIDPDYISISRGGSIRTAACSCGWKGPERGTLKMAADDSLTHELDMAAATKITRS